MVHGGNGRPPVYINETGTRQAQVGGAYMNETVAAAGGFKPYWAKSETKIIGAVDNVST